MTDQINCGDKVIVIGKEEKIYRGRTWIVTATNPVESLIKNKDRQKLVENRFLEKVVEEPLDPELLEKLKKHKGR